MQYGFNIAKIAFHDPQAKIVFMLIVGNIATHQIAELIAFSEVIHHQNICVTAAIQATHQIAADKAGSAGDYDHKSSPAVTTEVPNLPTTIPPARLAKATDSTQSSPAARATANVANTVSPAPDTSNTSCACAPIW